MKILITGSNGYIANNLHKHFTDKGHDVVKVSVRDGIEGIKLDGFDTLIHCAAIVHKKEKNYTLEYYNKYNYTLTIELAKKAKDAGVRHFVFISSMSVYGLVTSGVGIDINTKENPVTYYGKSKLKAETELNGLADDSFLISILRPPMVYGKGCVGNYNSLSKLAKITPIFPQVDNKRSMIYITNLCLYISDIVENEKVGLFLPQDSEYMNTSRLVAEIAKQNDRKIYMSKMLGKIVKLINLGVFKKVFGSLYYVNDDEKPAGHVGFEAAIRETEKK